ncbi:MAG: hypothetical protein ACP5PK_05145, partial [candidate division WOR-3 bacterium]
MSTGLRITATLKTALAITFLTRPDTSRLTLAPTSLTTTLRTLNSFTTPVLITTALSTPDTTPSRTAPKTRAQTLFATATPT